METAVYLMVCGILCIRICIAIDISRILSVVKRYDRKEGGKKG